MPNDKVPDIEALKVEFHKLDKEKTTAEANLKTSQDELQKLQEESRRIYQTDDLDELKRQLEAMRAENTRLLTEYDAHLKSVKLELEIVRQQFEQKP